MKIVSWNVNGIRAAQKKGLLNFLDQTKPDIFCVQETKARPEQLDAVLLEPAGMKAYWSSAMKAGYSGTGTFVRRDIEKCSYGINIEKFDSEGRFVVTHHADFDLYNVYFPNGASGKERHLYKQEFLVAFTEHLRKEIKAGRNIIVLGDYNVAPLSIDVYDPLKLANTSGFLPEEREWFQNFLKLGFIDTFRYFYPEEKNRYSWWNQMERARLGNRGWRIDMICVTESLKQRLKSADIWDQIEGSDHCPVVLELQ